MSRFQIPQALVPAEFVSGGMTLISTTTFNNTASAYNLTSIPQTYKHLRLIGNGLQSAAAGAYGNVFLRFNNNSTASNYGTIMVNANTGGSGWTGIGYGPDDRTYIPETVFANTSDTSLRFGTLVLDIYNYTDTSSKAINIYAASAQAGGGRFGWGTATFLPTDAITQINIGQTGQTNFKAGTLRLYGVS